MLRPSRLAMRHSTIITRRLALEQGTLQRSGKRRVALVYPSPYPVGMASLGFQTVYRTLNALPDTAAERAFLPDDETDNGPLLTYESGRPATDFQVVGFSVAYELEIAGVFRCLTLMGVPLRRQERSPRHPLVMMGGPLTFSNPLPLAPFADLIVLGEAEDVLPALIEVLFEAGDRVLALERAAALPGVFVPAVHGEVLPSIAQARDEHLPAYGQILTPESALPNMFLVESERGCHRGCTFCVMRRSTNGGMRLASPERVLGCIPPEAKRVGLVGAAVTDHPRIVDIVQALVESGREVGLSSLRADRLTPKLVEWLVRGGYRTLTVASDGASERLRGAMEKRIREKHLLRAAELAAEYRIPQLKVYMMIGVPGETDADLEELVDFGKRQADVVGRHGRVALGVATFVAKRNTPLDRTPFVGIAEADRRMRLLRRALMPRIEVRPTSARWAWVEYVLAQGGPEAGEAALLAWQRGGRFSDYKAVFGAVRVIAA